MSTPARPPDSSERTPDESQTSSAERPSLDPPSEEMRRLGYRAVDFLVDHLTRLPDLPVSKRRSGKELSEVLDEPLPLEGRGADDAMRFFSERIVPTMTKVSHPRFHAYIPGPGSFQATLGEILASATNPFVGSWLGGASFAQIELITLRWLGEAIGFERAHGIFTSGGSMANLTAIAAARARHGESTLDDGVLYFSEQGHASAVKAARVLGYAPRALRAIPVDDTFRMLPAALEEAIQHDRSEGRAPFFICANAGTTNTGAIDPMSEIADIAQRLSLWFHVDGAYGGFAAIAGEGKTKLRGFERADSVTLDPHKWLSAPFGTGCVLLRDHDALARAFATEGDYLKDVPRDEVNFFDRGPELSRRARALPVWFLLRSVGLDALSAQVEYDFTLAREVEERIAAHPALEIVTPAQLSVVTFRFARQPDESESERSRRDEELMERTLERGVVMLSSTLLHGRTAMRFVVMNHRTSEVEIERSLEEVFTIVDELAPTVSE